MSKNDITGDEIKSRVVTDKFRDNFDNIFKKKVCRNCKDTLWVCETHKDQEAHNCMFCEGAGMPCECNPDALMPPGFTVILEINDD